MNKYTEKKLVVIARVLVINELYHTRGSENAKEVSDHTYRYREVSGDARELGG